MVAHLPLHVRSSSQQSRLQLPRCDDHRMHWSTELRGPCTASGYFDISKWPMHTDTEVGSILEVRATRDVESHCFQVGGIGPDSCDIRSLLR